MTIQRKPSVIGPTDPDVARTLQARLTQAAVIANGRPTVSDSELILPRTTARATATSVTLNTSANNQPSDTVTVYPSSGNVYVSSIDQTLQTTIVNQTGVYSIIAGNNVTITSTGADGTGNVTINALLDGNSAPGGSNTQVQFNDAGSFGGNTGFTFIKTTGIFTSPFVAGNGNGLSNIQGANVSGFVPNANVANTAFAVAAANVSGLGNIATINLTGSNSNVLYGNGVFAAVAGGGANTGNVTFNNQIILGTGSNDGSGGLYLAPGTGSIANSAVQYLRVRGGDNLTHIHLDTGNNQAYDQYFGDDAKYVKLELGNTGNVVIGTDDATGNLYNWTFTSDGNFILANGNSVIQSIANSSLDPLNPNVSTMVLTPDPGYSTQALVLDPTAPGHIHLRAPGANIDEPSANIFLGGETSSFEVGYYNGAAPNLFIHSGNNTWTFDNTGNLNLPTNGNLNFNGGSIAQTLNEDIYIRASDDESDGWSVYNVVDDGAGNILSQTRLEFDQYSIRTDAQGNSYTWAFRDTGVLELPGDLYGNAGSNLTVKIGDQAGSNTFIDLQTRSYVGDALISNIHVAPNVTISTSNATHTWTFGDDGRLTFPGTPRIDTDANNFEVQAAEAINFEANTVVNIYTDSGNNAYQWQFGDDGNLIVPGNTAISTSNATGGNAGNSITIKAGAADQSDYYTTAGGNLNLVGGLGATDDGGGGGPGGDVNIASGLSADPAGHAGNINITAGSNDWIFDYNGDLTLPGNLVYIGASPAPSISGFNSVSAEEFTNDTSNVTINANSSTWTFGTNDNLYLPDTTSVIANASITLEANSTGNITGLSVNGDADANLYAHGNVKIVSDSSNTTATWSFGSNGNLTLPANTFAINYANGTQVSLGGSNISNGNSNVNIATANGNVTISAVGNTTMTVTGTGANVTGTLNVTGNITGNTNGFTIGYLNIPQVAASNTTIALTDAGKHYYSTTAGNFTLTVPNNTSASFATGTAISIVVQAAGNILVNASSGVTLYMAGNSTAANRVVGGYGMATLMKVATDTWFINGTGVA